MNFSLYIAKRYLISKSSNNAINIITGIAAVGVVVGALSLFIVLSGFSGLKDFSLQFSSVFDSDLKAFPQTGKTFTVNPEQEQEISSLAEVQSFSKIIEERVFLTFKGKNSIAYIKGVDENYQSVNFIDSTLIVGGWFESPNNAIVGIGISNTLSLGVYDYSDLLEIYVPKPGSGQITDPSQAFNKERVLISGIYHVNEELNSKYVFTPIRLARSLLSFGENDVSSIEFKITPGTKEEDVIQRVSSILNQELVFKNRMQQNDALYKMLNTENLAVYLIFTLVLIIALFNVIANIIMIILDKKHNLKTMIHLGATVKEVRKIFYLQGVLMTVTGGIVGIVLGIVVVLLQLKFNLVMITSTLPYPVKIELFNVIIVFVTIFILGIVASKIASNRVSENILKN